MNIFVRPASYAVLFPEWKDCLTPKNNKELIYIKRIAFHFKQFLPPSSSLFDHTLCP